MCKKSGLLKRFGGLKVICYIKLLNQPEKSLRVRTTSCSQERIHGTTVTAVYLKSEFIQLWLFFIFFKTKSHIWKVSLDMSKLWKCCPLASEEFPYHQHCWWLVYFFFLCLWNQWPFSEALLIFVTQIMNLSRFHCQCYGKKTSTKRIGHWNNKCYVLLATTVHNVF